MKFLAFTQVVTTGDREQVRSAECFAQPLQTECYKASCKSNGNTISKTCIKVYVKKNKCSNRRVFFYQICENIESFQYTGTRTVISRGLNIIFLYRRVKLYIHQVLDIIFPDRPSTQFYLYLTVSLGEFPYTKH